MYYGLLPEIKLSYLILSYLINLLINLELFFLQKKIFLKPG